MIILKKCIVATIKRWNINNFEKLKKTYPDVDMFLVTKKEELTISLLESYQPDYIFFPHWSWIIPKKIYNNYNCIVFHMTDLPFGRGGSPLQNLIVRGVYDTRISAIMVCSGVDTGPIYFKESINISEGNADDMFTRISDVVFSKMIPRFISEDVVPEGQKGEVVSFERRKPEQSEIPGGLSQRQIYDYIRMLDGEGYPTAYKTYDGGKIYFSNAKLLDGIVLANARFVEDGI